MKESPDVYHPPTQAHSKNVTGFLLVIEISCETMCTQITDYYIFYPSTFFF